MPAGRLKGMSCLERLSAAPCSRLYLRTTTERWRAISATSGRASSGESLSRYFRASGAIPTPCPNTRSATGNESGASRAASPGSPVSPLRDAPITGSASPTASTAGKRPSKRFLRGWASSASGIGRRGFGRRHDPPHQRAEDKGAEAAGDIGGIGPDLLEQ